MLDVNVRNKKATIIMAIGVVINVVLFAVKLYIGLASSSIGILTDAINNLGDVFTCAIAILCFFFIKNNTNKKQEDNIMQFGYGRLEYLASFIMSIVICIVGVYFFITAINRLMLASLVTFKWVYFGVLLFTVFVKAGMAVFYKISNRNLNSDVVKCAYYDSILDTAITMMTVIGILLNKYIQLRLDAIFGIIISIMMIIGGIKLCIDGLKSVIGKKLTEQEKEEIIEVCNSIAKDATVKSIELFDYGVNNKIILINLIFTNTTNSDIIKNIIFEISEQVKIKFGYSTRISL